MFFARQHFFNVIGSCTLFVALSASQASPLALDVQEFTLDNGMKFLVAVDDSIPNATSHIFWRVGSRNEAPGTTGIAHFFEHMMFNGAKRYGPKQFDKTMEANGGRNNAYTSENVTVYTNWFPATALETIFDLESDRIEHLNISSDIVESERQVVASERRTGLENSNFRALHEEVKNAAFRAHPYSWPVIGHESDIQNWKLEELQAFHKLYYAPNNAVAVIVGAVDVDKVRRLAEQYFGPIKAQQEPPPVRTVEPEQTGERRVYTHKPSASSVNVMLAYHIPATDHQDTLIIDLISDLLTSGRSSRLYQRLVDQQQLATEVWGYRPDAFDPTLLYFYAVATPDTIAEVLEQALIEEINQLHVAVVTDRELQKVKNQRRVATYTTFETINGKADLLGRLETFYGGHDQLPALIEKYMSVTSDDVQRVAQQYLQRSNRTVGVLSPTEDRD